MANKKTKREFFGELREIVKENAELVAFIDHEVELLDNKKGKSGVTKTQKENAEIKENLLAEMTNFDKAMTISEMQAESDLMAKYSNQKLSALLKQMVENDKTVVKTVEKKKSYFKVA